MPLYEYECDGCGHRFEVIQKFSDPLVDTCPKCGSAVHKLMSSPAFHLKGTGWYATDYAKKDSGAPPRSDSGSKSSGDSKEKTESKSDGESKTKTPETKSEGKSEAKTESKSDAKSESKSTKKSD
ncbi:MAG: zinc ribbon domain-containing protein [Acidobacteriia bacterium]|nr:zinc ribbon domain-containing protein [Terriglobia bacterium]